MTHAAILAGGRSRRFDGRDKSMLRVDGQTILDRQLTALAGLADQVWLVGYRGVAPDPSVTIVPDRLAARGPLGGLDAALAAADGALLVLACDMPNVTQPMLRHLIQRLDGMDAVVPRSRHGYHPLCAVYASSCRAAVRRRLESGALRMIDLLGDLRVCDVTEAELAPFGAAGHLLANVNTQADLDGLVSHRNH
jgi:molybdopterin-guanine dinucleotide biosynthesis protein A